MTVLGFEISMRCQHCGRAYEFYVGCSHSGRLLHESGYSYNCAECYSNGLRLEDKPRKGIEELWVENIDNSQDLSEASAELYDYLDSTPNAIYDLSPNDFEKLVADILRRKGFVVEITPLTRDGGVDIIACYDDSLDTPLKYLVECKLWNPASRKVGLPQVQRLLGVTYSKSASKGVIVTTSSFTRDAKKFVEQNEYHISLVDYDGLRDLIKSIRRRPQPTE